ncbi:hypothetical protein P152DRAFT_472348 [Eremomyces bilateralis CBS 781.70]|uniref:Uncharacterized protein n=1 Tax=Eremomyces bilateralis CBS 781.70 TaxID=1392243 RepID=A0A6G1G925_9PEZI|nr:uncharacterized protein P152DRAFT_472348 [Eremomyces bilateralis CBS 781.70]KAF1814605.1 hypothetical protein P152DRAFT_472348 [Eremomyces bilateralis CBS 781.70]
MAAYPPLPPTNLPSHRPYSRLPDLMTHKPGGYTIQPFTSHDLPRAAPPSARVPLTPDSSSCSSPRSRRGSNEADDGVHMPPMSSGGPWFQGPPHAPFPPSLPSLPPMLDRSGAVPRHLVQQQRLSPLDTTSGYLVCRTSHSTLSLRDESESMSPASPSTSVHTSTTTSVRSSRKRGLPSECHPPRSKRKRPTDLDGPSPPCPGDDETDPDEPTSGEKKRLNEKQNRRELTDAIGGIQTTLLEQGVQFDIESLQNHNQRTSGLRFKKVETLTRAHKAIIQGSRLAEAIEGLKDQGDAKGGKGPSTLQRQASWMSEEHVDDLIRVMRSLAGKTPSD